MYEAQSEGIDFYSLCVVILSPFPPCRLACGNGFDLYASIEKSRSPIYTCTLADGQAKSVVVYRSRQYNTGALWQAALCCIPTVIAQRQSESSPLGDQVNIQTSIVTAQDKFVVVPSHLQHGAGQISVPYTMGAMLHVVHTAKTWSPSEFSSNACYSLLEVARGSNIQPDKPSKKKCAVIATPWLLSTLPVERGMQISSGQSTHYQQN